MLLKVYDLEDALNSKIELQKNGRPAGLLILTDSRLEMEDAVKELGKLEGMRTSS
jgi:hypothetical protein